MISRVLRRIVSTCPKIIASPIFGKPRSRRFPYKGIGPRSYYTVTSDGVLNQLHAVGELREAIKRAKQGEVALLAVWTGQYNSDLFFIDDLDAIESAGI